MGANQSTAGHRPRKNKSSPPPPYSNGVTTTATPKRDGPQEPATKGLPLSPEQPGEQCTAELAAKLQSLERAVSELQRVGAPKSSKQANLTGASITPTDGTQDTIGDQLQAMKDKNQSLKEQKRNLEEQKRNLEEQKSSLEEEKSQWAKDKERLEKENRSLEEKTNHIEGRLDEQRLAQQDSYKTIMTQLKAMNKLNDINSGHLSRIRELQDDVQTLATEALKAKVLE
ncbi:hypothetical protein KVR01_003278 [Diaporthe batatas]|uniref:uncharacterized protein n=1 Tax=Diaporthe batatas TaxID=748121 RepID=UPI001D0388E0|nr:uncharacterized protein KVR01_003278 [Diaporthe batatas]KAG8167589.1 hypothetical protein KVR01_003278 [Diaporthe batatas]